MNELNSKKVVVLGAGIVGLTTALRIYERFEQSNSGSSNTLDLTIISEKFDTETTSDGAGGLFRPDDRFMGGVPKELARQWTKESFDFFHKLMFSTTGGLAGVFQASGYQLFDDQREDPSYKDIIYQFRHLTKNELDTFPRKFKYGYFSTTIGIESRMLMKYITEILKKKKAKFCQKKLTKIEDFIEYNSYDIVFNCLGLGNLEFCNDQRLLPIRGQIIRVIAPWIKHFYYTDDLCYIIPNVNTICLGGTRQTNNFSKVLDETDSKGIFERCKELCPSLENCQVKWEWVGLRPHREPIRVEPEIMSRKSGEEVLIIHNYGHGGNGISLSPGTSNHAVRLLENLLTNGKLKK